MIVPRIGPQLRCRLTVWNDRRTVSRSESKMSNQGQGSTAQSKYHYFVDAKKYDTDQASISGAEIKAKIPDFNPAYQLFLEGHGGQPDRLISDADTISLDQQGEGV